MTEPTSPVHGFLWDDEPQHPPTPATPQPRRSHHVEGVPGEPGLWIFLLGDMTIFGVFFCVFLWENRQDRPGFHASTLELLQPIGVVNTLVLLLSSYLVVLAVRAHRDGLGDRAARLVTGTLGCAALFAALKAVEYSLELGAGHTPESHRFFMFYYVLTGVHLLHVVIGGIFLVVWRRQAVRRPWEDGRGLAEGTASYWHMVDLLWIVIFTLLYLVCVA